MKKSILIVFLLSISIVGKMRGQELSNYNLYMQNGFLYNPAYAIDNMKYSAFINSHLQWVGFDNAPRVSTFGFNAAIAQNSGVGLSVIDNRAGLIRDFAAKLSYAHRVVFSKSHFLRLGISAGFTNNSLGQANNQTDLSDGILVHNAFNNTSFLGGAGLAYAFRGLELQFMIPHLLRRGETDLYNISSLSYRHNINSNWDIAPSVMLRNVADSPTQYDINMYGSWRNTVWSQLGYRSNNSLLVSLGVNIQGFNVAYNHEFNRGALSAVSRGTHEIQVVYSFGEVVPKVSKSKRSKKSVLAVYVKNTVDNTPVEAMAVISENEAKIAEAKSDSITGIFSLELPMGKVYKLNITAEGYYPHEHDFTLGAEELTQQFDISLIPKKAVLDGYLRNKSTGKPVSGNISIFENDKFRTSVKTNGEGYYETELLSNRTYSLRVKAESFKESNIELTIPAKETTAQQNIALQPDFQLKGMVVDAESGEQIRATINVKVAGKDFGQVNVSGKYDTALPKGENYELEYSAEGYLSQTFTFEKREGSKDIPNIIKLQKLKKGEAFQLGAINFKMGTSILTENSYGTLDVLIKMLKDNPTLKVEIAGHTDSDGSKAGNLRISQQRALSCSKYLISKGINYEKLKIVGYGEDKPIAPNDNPNNKAKNRRVEFKFID